MASRVFKVLSVATLVAVMLGSLVTQSALAQVSLTTSGTPYTQPFDTLSASGSATWTNNSTIPGWFHARTGTGTTIVANDGSTNAGNLYSYGTGTATDRALGSLGSGNAAIGDLFWGVRLQNNTGATITSLDVSYIGEQWRNSAGAAQTIAFSYLVGSPTVTGSLAEFQSAGVRVSALDFSSPITGGAAGALNGNLAANRLSMSSSISGLAIPNGTEVMLRWSDPDHTGPDHGLSIDQFSVTPNGALPSPNLTIGDVAASEGDSGTTGFTFTVSLSSPAGPGGVTFDVATADGTARDDTPTSEDNDYVARSVTAQTVPQGSSTYTFNVTVNGDTTIEPNETFFVNVSNVTGANVGDGQGQGTIQNDDVDDTPPDTAIDSAPATPSGSSGASFTFDGTDTETGVASFQCQLDTGGFSACTSPQSYSSLGDGEHTFQVRAIDASGNVDATPASFTWTIDATRPSVTIEQPSGQPDPTSASPINFSVEFSEPVTGFSGGDITLGGTAGAATAVVAGGGTTYNVTVSGMTAAGTVTASIPANAATDVAGNGNTASTSSDNTVTFNSNPAAGAAPPAGPETAAAEPAISRVWLGSRCVRRARSGRVRVLLNMSLARSGPVEIRIDRAIRSKGRRSCPQAGRTARPGHKTRLRTVTTIRRTPTQAAAAAALARRLTLNIRLTAGLYRLSVRTQLESGQMSAPIHRYLRVIG